MDLNYTFGISGNSNVVYLTSPAGVKFSVCLGDNSEVANMNLLSSGVICVDSQTSIKNKSMYFYEAISTVHRYGFLDKGYWVGLGVRAYALSASDTLRVYYDTKTTGIVLLVLDDGSPKEIF